MGELEREQLEANWKSIELVYIESCVDRETGIASRGRLCRKKISRLWLD